MISNKIFAVQQADALLECINTTGSKVYRVEEVPVDEVDLAEDEVLVPVAHFNKDVFCTFGTPFFIKLKQVSERQSCVYTTFC